MKGNTMAIDLLDHTPQEPLNCLQYRYGLWAWSRTCPLHSLLLSIYGAPIGLNIILITHWKSGAPFGLKIFVGCLLSMACVILVGFFIKEAATQRVFFDNAQALKTIEEFLTSDNELHRQFALLIAKHYV
jgi:uncharacterized membrane protein YhhN